MQSAAPATQYGPTGLEWLQPLRELLAAAMKSLAAGEAGDLILASRRVTLYLQNSAPASFELCRMPISPEAQRRQRELLGELREQSAFCRAMLRRWRRSMLLRRQVFELGGEPLPYTEVLEMGGQR